MDQCKTGELIRQLRKERGLTQEEMAEQFGVSSRTVSRWETGRNLPDLDLLLEMADFFEMDLRALLTGERAARGADRAAEETARQLAGYSGEEKRRLKKRLHLLFLVGLAAAGVSIFLSAAELRHPAARFLTGFGQGMAFGLMAVGALMTSRVAGAVQRAKRRLLCRAKGQ